MKLKLTIPMLALLIVAAAGVASAVAFASSSTTTHSALVIRHQVHGCHAWALNGGALKSLQTVTIHRDASISVTNNDVMSHKIVKTSGPAVTITRITSTGMKMTATSPAFLGHMGAAAKITFSHAGTYTFTTKAGEDYMPGVKTIGEDHVLKLKVIVS